MVEHVVKKRSIYEAMTACVQNTYQYKVVGLKKSNYTLKITIFVSMWNLGQFHENLIFCQYPPS